MSVFEQILRQQCDNSLDYIEQNILPELDKWLTVYHKSRKNILNNELQITFKDYQFLNNILKIMNKIYL